MRFFRKWPVHIAAFIIGFVMINKGMEFLLLRISGEPMILMHDLSQVENVDIAFVGNSLSRRHICNAVVEETLDKDSFNLSISSARFTGCYALMRELFNKHNPEILVFVYDPNIAISYTESIVIEAELWPFLKDKSNKIEYIIENCKLDGAYLDRFFPWRCFYPQSLSDFYENLLGKLNIDNFYQSKLQNFLPFEKSFEKNDRESKFYDRKGFFPLSNEKNSEKLASVQNRRVKMSSKYDMSILEPSIQKIFKLCEDHNCRLIIISTPQLPQVLLGNERVQCSFKEMEIICQKYQIPLFNFAYAKSEYFSDMTDYIVDVDHLGKDGAITFSSEVAKVLNEYLSGQDISDCFYTQEEYAASMDYVLNGWYTESKKNGKITYTADSIYGFNVNPEYQFVMIDENGKSNIVQEYSGKNKYVCEENVMNKKEIQVYIRNGTDLNQPPVLAAKK